MQVLNILLIFGLGSAILADNSCIFEHPTKGVINLSSVGLRNSQPRFQDVSPALGSNYVYSFNPCFSFMENSCRNAAVCQITNDRQYAFTLAAQNLSTWTVDSNMRPTLTYTYGPKTVAITMICSNVVSDQFEVLGESYSNYYAMRLISRCACWGGCGSPPPISTTPTAQTSPATTTHSIYYSACRYRDSRYGTIDLSSIGSMSGKPKFKDVRSIYSNNYVWSYNPCYTFSEDNCRNVAGCQIDQTRDVSYAIGMQEYAYWLNMNSTNNLVPSIVYPSSLINRRLTVQLICDRLSSSHHLQVLGETSVGEYVMQLTSPCACWDGCLKPTPSPSPFDGNFWMITGIVGCVVFVLFLILITCLFCSKPKRRRYPYFIVSEKTPFLNGTI